MFIFLYYFLKSCQQMLCDLHKLIYFFIKKYHLIGIFLNGASDPGGLRDNSLLVIFLKNFYWYWWIEHFFNIICNKKIPFNWHFFKWSGRRDSNSQQSAWKAGTLANWVTPAYFLGGPTWTWTKDRPVMSRLL